MSTPYDPERIRRQLRTIRAERMFRVIHQKHRCRPLGAVPSASRFSDPAGNYAVLYTAESVRCAFWEAVARNRFTRRRRRELPRSDVEARLAVLVRSHEDLVLIDLRADGPIQIGAPTAVAHDSNQTAGRALSAATFTGVPEADGFLFQSRFMGQLCIATFDRAIGKLDALAVSPLIENVDFLKALKDYDIQLTTPPE